MMRSKMSVVAVVVGTMLLGACGDDGPRRQASSGCDPAVEECPGIPGLRPYDEAPEPFPEGTVTPIGSDVGVVDGRFEERTEAAFDRVIDQRVSEAALTAIYGRLSYGYVSEAPLLYKEFRCPMRLRRVEVYAPTDSFFLYSAMNYPAGGTGEVTVVGRQADSPLWSPVATKPFGAERQVSFGPEDLESATDYVAYGVTFSSDSPRVGQVQVAEVGLYGFCSSQNHSIAWETSDWLCNGAECVEESNPGTAQRTVSCARDAGGFAHPDFCAGEEPPAEERSCELSCPYELVHVGARPFTYANDSGWLHESTTTYLAGPLPQDVAFGTSVEAIEGQPCSVLTEGAETYFAGISCTVPVEEGEEALYCAFRCE